MPQLLLLPLKIYLDLKRNEAEEGELIKLKEKNAFINLVRSFQEAGLTAYNTSFCPKLLQSLNRPSFLLIRPELNRGYFSRYPADFKRNTAQANFQEPELKEEVQRLIKEVPLTGLSLFHGLNGLTELVTAAREVKPEIEFAFWTVNSKEDLNSLLNKINHFKLQSVSIISNEPLVLQNNYLSINNKK